MSNYIGTTFQGKGGKGLGQGDYGVLLFNAANNNVARSGKGANLIRGSGIAPFREYTGPVPKGPTTGAGLASATGAKPRSSHHAGAGSGVSASRVTHTPTAARHHAGRPR
jgi:hypothetical protein